MIYDSTSADGFPAFRLPIHYVRNFKFDRRETGGVFRNKRVTLYA